MLNVLTDKRKFAIIIMEIERGIIMKKSLFVSGSETLRIEESRYLALVVTYGDYENAGFQEVSREQFSERLKKIEWMKDCSCERLKNDYNEMVKFFEKVGK